MFASAFLFGAGALFAVKRGSKQIKRPLKRNVGFNGRMGCVALGAGLFAFAILTTWNPLVLLASGFLYFEALTGKCSFYYFLTKKL